MQTLTIEVPDQTFEGIEALPAAQREELKRQLARAARAYLFDERSKQIREALKDRNPYRTEQELYDDVS